MDMKERPIIFSSEMVRAILDGRKTQTRRVVKSDRDLVAAATAEDWARGLASGANFGRTITEDDIQQKAVQVKGRLHPFVDADGLMIGLLCPYGKPGDRIWIKEPFRFAQSLDGLSPRWVAEKCLDAGYKSPWAPIQFEADGIRIGRWFGFDTPPVVTKPGKLRSAIQMPRWASRIQLEIVDVRVERLQDISEADAMDCGAPRYREGIDPPPQSEEDEWSYAAAFHRQWKTAHGSGSADGNPWLWVIDFRRVA